MNCSASGTAAGAVVVASTSGVDGAVVAAVEPFDVVGWSGCDAAGGAVEASSAPDVHAAARKPTATIAAASRGRCRFVTSVKVASPSGECSDVLPTFPKRSRRLHLR